MIQKYWQFEQTEASSTWEVNNVPEGAVGAAITHVQTTTGQILQPESQTVAPYGLQLSLGILPVAGIAYGEYYVEANQIVTDEAGNVVNITVTQNGGTAPEGSTF